MDNSDFGYKDLFEIQIEKSNYMYSASLNRKYLREDEIMLSRKHSRKTEKEVVLFGIVTQNGGKEKIEIEDDTPTINNIKAAIKLITEKFIDVEKHFIGRLDNEVIIDPIAVYI